MCLQPKGAGRSSWVNCSLLPPRRFVAAAMQLAMMGAAKWHRILIADLATECLPLDKPQMMRVRGITAANQTRLLGHEFYMLTIAQSARLGMR